MKKINFKKIVLPFVAMLICMVVFCLSSCTNNKETGIKTVSNVETRNTISNPADNATVHYTESKASFTEKAASSGLIELHIDPKSNTFGVLDTSLNQYWTTLPLLDETVHGQTLIDGASFASLKIAGGTDVYYLNTQDNSVNYGKASYSVIENGAEFKFDIFPDKKTAEKSVYEKNDIGFRLKIKVVLLDGSMNVDCSYENITGNADAYIESITLLDSFGCYNNSGEEDFLLVPDGSGAIIKTSVFDESFESLEFAVYGEDPSFEAESDGDAIVPAFGIKHGNGAFVALIEDGDAVARICADKAKSFNEYNKVYSTFTVTPITYDNQTIYISKTITTDNISLCYRFLNGNNATYSGLASACREQLIRNAVLSTSTVTETNYLPFFLTLNGAVTQSFGPVDYTAAATTFEQAQDMLSRMKSKGINNVNLRYTGAFSGGVNSKDINAASLLSRLGGKSGLDELYDYVSTQKMNLFLDINVLTSSSGFSSAKALDILKDSSAYYPDSSYDYMNSVIKTRNLRALDNLKNIITNILTSTKSYSFSGFCINDAGNILYSDFSHGGLLRQESAETVSKAIRPLSTSKTTMAVKGNFYMLKNIDCIVNLPLKANAAASGSYISVPFVQLILHGIVDYSADPINTQPNINETLLKYIEYGACPHFAWSYEPNGETKTDLYYYDNTINTAAEFYGKANEILFDLREARITDHYEVHDGVFCTEYDTGTMVYVNYTDSECAVNGIVVEAKNCFRVN